MLNLGDVQMKFLQLLHALYVKRVRIWSFSGPYFPAFGANKERHSVSLRIKSEFGKKSIRKTPNTESFHAVAFIEIFTIFFHKFSEIDIY